MCFHRHWHIGSSPWTKAFEICFLCKTSQGQEQLGRKLRARNTVGHEGETEREIEKLLTIFIEDKYMKPTLRIWKWRVINTRFDISDIWPLLNWSNVSSYTAIPSSITVREEITKPLNNYFSYRFVSLVSFLLLQSRGTYSSCHCDACSFVT